MGLVGSVTGSGTVIEAPVESRRAPDTAVAMRTPGAEFGVAAGFLFIHRPFQASSPVTSSVSAHPERIEAPA